LLSIVSFIYEILSLVRGQSDPQTQTLPVFLYLLPVFSLFLDCTFLSLFSSRRRRYGCKLCFYPLFFYPLSYWSVTKKSANSRIYGHHSGVWRLIFKWIYFLCMDNNYRIILYPSRNSLLGVYSLLSTIVCFFSFDSHSCVDSHIFFCFLHLCLFKYYFTLPFGFFNSC